MRVCIQLRSNNASKTVIRFSSGACNIVEISSATLYFLDPKLALCSRECILSIMIPETGNNFDRWHAFIREEFDDDVLLFDLRIFDTIPQIYTFTRQIFPAMTLDAIHFYTMKGRMQRSFFHASWIKHSVTDGESGSISNIL
jgi:hypothetical protein